MRIGQSVVIEAGLRAGSESYTPDGVHLSPRLNIAWTPAPRTSVRAAWGVFHQPQEIQELQVEDGVTLYQPAQRSETASASRRKAGVRAERSCWCGRIRRSH